MSHPDPQTPRPGARWPGDDRERRRRAARRARNERAALQVHVRELGRQLDDVRTGLWRRPNSVPRT